MTSDELMFQFGRSSFQMADGSVIAENDYQKVETAFDGVSAIYDWEAFRAKLWYINFLDLFMGDGDDESLSYGLSIDIQSIPSWLTALNVHVMQNNEDSREDAKY